ncbi:MAG: tungstate ABC transporter substrate-binding protein WtpA [Anaerolineae bacterium]|nr:tungstate ABC transporter substrate-binding protein WtpA [Anaerolineae bacterium]
MKAIEQAFEAENPDIDLQMEYHGSIQVIRHVTELKEPIDVVITADHALIPTLMYAVTNTETNQPYADWYIRFATNHLAVAYTDASRYQDEVNSENWYEVLSRPDVKVGIADPRFDAAGYRSFMVVKLAEEYYGDPDIFFDFFAGEFRSPVKTNDEDGLQVIHIPEIVETKPNSHIIMRGASIQLIALLESGDLDYAFEYESVIAQHDLNLVHLPDQLNMGEAAYQDYYDDVEVRLDFQRFQSVNPVFKGERIGYGITIPTNSSHQEDAERFISYLLGEKGRAIMLEYQHPLFEPAYGNNYDNIPASLKDYVVPEPND